MTAKKLILTSDPNPTDPEPGIYHDLSWEKYAAWNCFSKSMVSSALRSGAHLDHYIHGERKTKSMALGSLVDTLVLEPEFYQERYVMQPRTYETEKTTGRGDKKVTETIEKPWNLNSKTCKAMAEEIAATGKEIVSESDLEKASILRDALMASPEAALAITEGEKQVSFVWVDEDTGVKCKGRADLVNSNTIDDLKTAVDASPEEFARACGRFLYHVQAAAYTEGWNQVSGESKTFRFIAAETSGLTDPPQVALYVLNPISIAAGSHMFHRALDRVKKWLDHGIAGYSTAFEPIDIPRWAIAQEGDMGEAVEVVQLPTARLVPRKEES